MNLPRSRVIPGRLAYLFCAAASVGILAIADDEPPRTANKEGYTDTPLLPGGKWHIHDPNRPQPPIVTPGKRFSQEAPPPSDAIVLFDGTDFSKWVGERGPETGWKIVDGAAEAARGKIRTKDDFGDCQLHIEWATPTEIKGNGQGRGNNGVSFLSRYEIQILDSYENLTYPDGQAGAIYGQRPPLVNASKPPGEWQTYDIIWESPRWDEAGKLVKKAFVTVLHNGVIVHNRRELIGHTPWKQMPNYDTPHPPKGQLELYYHGNPVRFRNIWIRPMPEREE